MIAASGSVILMSFPVFRYTGGTLYLQVICSKTYCSYMKLQTIPNAIYNAI